MNIETEQISTDSLTPEKALEVLSKHSLSVVSSTRPDDGKSEKGLFLGGIKDNPDHSYSKLEQVDDEIDPVVHEVMSYFTSTLDIPEKSRAAYLGYLESFQSRHRLLALMKKAKLNPSAENDKNFMRQNIEVFGEPDQQTFLSIFSDKIASFRNRELGPSANELRSELFRLVPSVVTETDQIERYRPRPKTVEWLKTVADTLYGDWAKHMPTDKDAYDAHDLKSVFELILTDEFEDSARDWVVVVDEERSGSVSVNASQKRINIPSDIPSRTREQVQGLLRHEAGVHVLRSIAGESTTLDLLRTGLEGYADSEEGLGMIMQLAPEGKFVDVGTDHYITSGYAYYEGKNFREVFEMKWRLAALHDMKDGESELTEEMVEAARDKAYNQTMRVMRGTDRLPLFKDLSYYNGSVEVWKYLDKICGDDLQLTLLLQGKVNTSPAHRRVILESVSV